MLFEAPFNSSGQIQMTDGEKKLLIALVQMVKQYLDEQGDLVDSLSMSAGEHAIEALSAFGLMESVNPRIGRWTRAGNEFIEEYVYPPFRAPNQT
jgi:hypothetical protein